MVYKRCPRCGKKGLHKRTGMHSGYIYREGKKVKASGDICKYCGGLF